MNRFLSLPRVIPVAVVGVVWANSGVADPQYASSVIELDETINHYQTADINGNGRRDLLINTWSQERGRELLVFEQDKNGKYPARPLRRIELKKDIVAYGLADVRRGESDKGNELIFFSRTAVFSFSPRQTRYAGNLKKLLDWPLIVSLPDEKTVAQVGTLADYNNDGHVDFLLPGRKHYRLFYGEGEQEAGAGEEIAGQESIEQESTAQFSSGLDLPTPFEHPESAEPDVSFEFTPEEGLAFTIDQASPFKELIAEGNGEDAPILNIERWLRGSVAVKINGDSRTDFVYLDDFPDNETDKKRLNVIIHPEQSKAAVEPTQQLTVSDHSEVRAEDVNGDSRAELYTLDHSEADRATLYFYPNQNGRLVTDKPHQVMKFSGYDVDVEIRDLNGDKRPELIISYYSLSAVDAVRNGNMLRTTLIYRAADEDTERYFQSRPGFKLTEKYSGKAFQGLVQRMEFDADINGDEISDAVSIDNEGALIVRPLDTDLQVSAEPAWRFVPLHLITRFVPQELNQDSVTDFVLLHQSSLTLLVSQP